MEKKGFVLDKRTVAAALLVLSFVMAFLPWVSMRLDLGVEGVHTLKDAYAYAAREDGTTAAEVRSQFISSMERVINRTIEAMKSAGVRVRLTGKQYVRTYKYMEDGLISPNELGVMTSTMSRLYKMELDYFKKTDNGSYGAYSAKVAAVRKIKNSLTAASVLLWIGMLLSFASFVLACRSLWKGDKRGTIPYAAVWLLLCIYVLIVVGRLNTPEMAQMWPTTLNGSSSGDVQFRFMVWPIFGMLMAAAVCVISHLPGGVKTSSAPVKAPGWTCPACGASCESDAVFCENCGTRKPQPRFCSVCGTKAPDDGVFCENCGARLESSNPVPEQGMNGNF